MENVFAPAVGVARPKITVIFEFIVTKPKATFYRGVQATDGSYRMEKRGFAAKKYRAIMWTGSEDGLVRFRESVEWCYGKASASVPSQIHLTK